MTFIKSKKALVLLATLVVAGIAAYGAVAYFTTTGSGTGSASVGTDTAVTLSGTADGTLYPGTSTVVHFKVSNSSAGVEHVASISLGGVTTDAAHSGCVTTDFTMAPVTVNQDFPSGSDQSVTATGTLQMANNGNQDACKNAPLTLNLSSN